MEKMRLWTDKDDKFLHDNILKGFVWMGEQTNRTPGAIKRRCLKLGLKFRDLTNKAKKKEMKRKLEKVLKPTNKNPFDASFQKIKNSGIEGKIPVYVPSEKLTIYVNPGADKQAAIDKFVNRHKS